MIRWLYRKACCALGKHEWRVDYVGATYVAAGQSSLCFNVECVHCGERDV